MKRLNSGIFLATLLAIIVPMEGTVTQPPMDTAGLLNSKDVRLNCTVSPDTAPRWEAIVPWRLLPQTLYKDKGIISNVNYTFAQDGSSFAINTLTEYLAAIYVCSDGQDEAAVRVAAMTRLSCSTTENVQTFVAGETAGINCSTSYSSYVKTPQKPLTPTMSLIKANSTEVARTRASAPGPFHLFQNVTMTADMDGQQLTCRIFFEKDEVMSRNSLDIQPPVYEDTCQYNLVVQYGVDRVKIDIPQNTTGPNVVQVGDSITCTANGQPKPTFKWLDSNGTVISTTETLTFTRQMVSPVPVTFTCQAMNSVNVPPAGGPTISRAEDRIQLTVTEPKVQEVTQLAPWAIALIVVIPLLVLLLLAIVIVVVCLRKKNRDKPYKALPKKNKYDPTVKSLIYNPTPQMPGTGTGLPQAYPPTTSPAYPNNQQSTFQPMRSPPVRSDFSNSPFGRPDYQPDYHGSNRNVNLNASSGHGDLGMAGLSGSRGADINAGSRGNLNEQTTGYRPRDSDRYGGSSEGLDLPPLLPPRQPEVNGPRKNNNQRQNNARSPPPPASYLDNGFGRQPSITSTSTNRSVSSEGSRVAGRAAEKNPGGRPNKSGNKRASPGRHGQPEGGKRTGNKKAAPARQSDGYDAHSLQGSEV